MVDFNINILDDTGAGVTGAGALTQLKIRRAIDNFLYDWNDGTFKNAGWTTLAAVVIQIDAVNFPGHYYKSVVATAWTDGFYTFAFKYLGDPVLNYDATICIVGGKEVELYSDALISSRLASGSYVAPDNTAIGTINTNLGTPVAMDGGEATIAGNLKKLADDAGGTTFNAETDSQRAIAAKASDIDLQTEKLEFTVRNPGAHNDVNVAVQTNADKDGYSISGTITTLDGVAGGVRTELATELLAINNNLNAPVGSIPTNPKLQKKP